MLRQCSSASRLTDEQRKCWVSDRLGAVRGQQKQSSLTSTSYALNIGRAQG